MRDDVTLEWRLSMAGHRPRNSAELNISLDDILYQKGGQENVLPKDK